MRKISSFLFILIVSMPFVFSQNALNEIEKTYNYVLEKLKKPLYSTEHSGKSQIFLETSTRTRCCRDYFLAVLFDPEELVSQLRRKKGGCSLLDLFFYVSNYQCSLNLGSFSIKEDIFDYDDTKKLLFGLLVISSQEMNMTFDLNIDLDLAGAVLYDFVGYWKDNEGDILNYLLFDPAQVPDSYKKDLEVKNNRAEVALKKEETIFSGEKGLYIWLYVLWGNFAINRDTPAGEYSGVYSVTFEPILDTEKGER